MNFIETLLFHPVMQTLGWTLVHFIWQGLVIAILMAGLTSALNRRSANLRYIIACSAMLLMFVMPITTFMVLRASAGNTAAMQAGATSVESTAQTETSLGVAVETQQVLGRMIFNRLSPVLPWMVCAWFLGVLALSLRLLGGWKYMKYLRWSGTNPVSSEYQQIFEGVLKRLRISKPVSLLESTVIKVPTVIGWLRPVILLPTSALTGLNADQIKAIIVHELAHIRRYDFLINLFQTMIETLLFYHPAVWWVSKRIRAERENCCDDIAVSVCGDVLNYVRALTELEQMRSVQPQLAVAATGGPLLGRIRRLVKEPSQRKNPIGLWLAGLLVLTAVIAAGASLHNALSSASAYQPPAYPQGSAEEQSAEGLKVLLQTLKGRNFEMKGEVMSALNRIRSSGTIEPLVQALHDGDESTREKVAWALGNLGDRRAVEPLAAALTNGDWRGQHTVAWALGMIRDRRAIEPLIQTLKKGNADARHGSAWALGMIGDKSAVEPLIALLKDEAADVRHGAAWALGMIGDESAVEALREAQNDGDSDVREAVNQALMKISR